MIKKVLIILVVVLVFTIGILRDIPSQYVEVLPGPSFILGSSPRFIIPSVVFQPISEWAYLLGHTHGKLEKPKPGYTYISPTFQTYLSSQNVAALALRPYITPSAPVLAGAPKTYNKIPLGAYIISLNGKKIHYTKQVNTNSNKSYRIVYYFNKKRYTTTTSLKSLVFSTSTFPPLHVQYRPPVNGASLGLLVTLWQINQKYNFIKPGVTITGTGSISPSGRIGSVVGVSVKLPSVQQYNPSVEFIPKSYTKSLPHTLDNVVRVYSIHSALSYICSHPALSIPNSCAFVSKYYTINK